MRMIKAFDGNVLAYKVDVTNAEEVYETANEVKQEVGDVTVLVNNAGVVTGKRLMNCSDDMIRKTMDVNVTSHFWVSVYKILELHCYMDKCFPVGVFGTLGGSRISRLT